MQWQKAHNHLSHFVVDSQQNEAQFQGIWYSLYRKFAAEYMEKIGGIGCHTQKHLVLWYLCW